MCNLYSITTNQTAIIALFRVINRYATARNPSTHISPRVGFFFGSLRRFGRDRRLPSFVQRRLLALTNPLMGFSG